MPERKKILNKMEMPEPKSLGKQAKESLDNWLEEYISNPMYAAGYENLGPGLAAAGSAAGELFIPEDVADVAMAAIPMGKLGKVAKGLGKVPTAMSKASNPGMQEAAFKAVPESANKLAQLYSELVFKGGEKIDERKAKHLLEAVETKAKGMGMSLEELEDKAYKIFNQTQK